MWEISNSLQLLSFARSLGLGAFLCLAYDILRAVRRARESDTLTVFLQDIVFSLFSSFVTFNFLLSVTGGDVRAFVLFGLALGFALTRLTVSLVFFRVLKFLILRISALFSYICRSFYKGFDYLEQKVAEICKKSGKN